MANISPEAIYRLTAQKWQEYLNKKKELNITIGDVKKLLGMYYELLHSR